MPHPLSAKLRAHQRTARLSRRQVEDLLNEHPLTAIHKSTRNIKFEYDREVDAAYLTLARGKVLESEEVKPGVIVDFGADDEIVGVEILRFAGRFISQAKQRITPTSRNRLLKKSA